MPLFEELDSLKWIYEDINTQDNTTGTRMFEAHMLNTLLKLTSAVSELTKFLTA